MPPVAVPSELDLILLDPEHDCSKLSLGSAEFVPLKIFLSKQAKSFHKNNIAKTYVLVASANQAPINPSIVWGYITLVCSQIELDSAQRPNDCDGAQCYKDFPAIKIARLAVHTELRKEGAGKALVNFAVGVTKEIMPKVGCRFIVVDAKKSAIRFYEKSGFTLLDTPTNKASDNPIMFLDMHKAS